jgi:PTH1 family peptidyl-tRNA hydrolase
MWLIVGLGNPGAQYESTRHNCGFMVVDELARRVQAQFKERESGALIARATLEGQRVLLAKPQTFMNESGIAVSGLKKKYDVALDEVLVLADELALPLGTIRLRRSGSAGGHNGLKSIIARLESNEFPRLRLGIGSEHPIGDAADFVLGEFSRRERDVLSETIARAADAVQDLLTIGIDTTMSKYNRVP